MKLLDEEPPPLDCTRRIIGDFVYSWDRFTKMLMKRHKDDRHRTLVALLDEPSAIDKIIYEDYH